MTLFITSKLSLCRSVPLKTAVRAVIDMRVSESERGLMFTWRLTANHELQKLRVTCNGYLGIPCLSRHHQKESSEGGWKEGLDGDETLQEFLKLCWMFCSSSFGFVLISFCCTLLFSSSAKYWGTCFCFRLTWGEMKAVIGWEGNHSEWNGADSSKLKILHLSTQSQPRRFSLKHP